MSPLLSSLKLQKVAIGQVFVHVRFKQYCIVQNDETGLRPCSGGADLSGFTLLQCLTLVNN